MSTTKNQPTTLHRAAAAIRDDWPDHVAADERAARDFHLAVAAWLEDIAERHKPDPEPADLVLHYEEPCPTGECEDPGYHEGCVVCWGCYPTWDGMDGHALYPCAETKAALAAADAYLGTNEGDHS